MSCLTLSNAILAPRAGSWDKYCTVTQCETVIVRSRKAQSKSLEAIQKRDIHITHNLTRGMPYFSMLYCAYLNSLASRRDLSRDFFPQHFGSSLLTPQPPPRSTTITSRLRSSQTFPKVHTRTQRYCSVIHYGLNHYQ